MVAWSSRAKLLNRRPDLGQFTALSDVTSDQDVHQILGNDLKENLMRLQKLFHRSAVRRIEKKHSTKKHKEKEIKRVVAMGEENVKIYL